MTFLCGGEAQGNPEPGHREGLVLVCMVLWYPSHNDLLVSHGSEVVAMGWAVVQFTVNTWYVLNNHH